MLFSSICLNRWEGACTIFFSDRITNCKLLHPYCFKRYVYKWVEGVPAFKCASDKSHAEKGNNDLKANGLDLININL